MTSITTTAAVRTARNAASGCRLLGYGKLFLKELMEWLRVR